MKKSCPFPIHDFVTAAIFCTYDQEMKDTNEVSLFTEIEDFIKAAKILEITDILRALNFLNIDSDIDKIMHSWEPKLHASRGFCYTFKSKELPAYTKDELNFKLSKLELELDVSFYIWVHTKVR